MGAFFACCGITASIPLARRMNVRLFRKALLGILVLSALMLMARGLAESRISGSVMPASSIRTDS